MSKAPLRKFQVVEAGADDWVEVTARRPSQAGEVWAETNFDSAKYPHGHTYELDIKDDSGKLWAVTVDIDVSVSFSGYADVHPTESKE